MRSTWTLLADSRARDFTAALLGLVAIVSCNDAGQGLRELKITVTVELFGTGNGTVEFSDPASSASSVHCEIVGGIETPTSECSTSFNDIDGRGRMEFVAAAANGSAIVELDGCTSRNGTICVYEFEVTSNVEKTISVRIDEISALVVSPATLTLEGGESATLSASVTDPMGASHSPVAGVSWTSANSTTASVAPGSQPHQATVTGGGVATQTDVDVTATVSGESDVATVTVKATQTAPSALEGDLLDEDDATVLLPDANKPILVRATGPGGALVPVQLDAAGHYRFDPVSLPGSYAVSTQGVVGLRFVSTDGESTSVPAGSPVTKDLRITTGYYLDVQNGPFTENASAGLSVPLDIDYHVWNRVNLPGAVTWLVVAVEGDAQVAHRVGIAGSHASQTAEASGTASISLTAPAASGTHRIFAFLAAVSTGTQAEQNYEADFPLRVDINYVHIGDITVP